MMISKMQSKSNLSCNVYALSQLTHYEDALIPHTADSYQQPSSRTDSRGNSIFINVLDEEAECNLYKFAKDIEGAVDMLEGKAHGNHSGRFLTDLRNGLA